MNLDFDREVDRLLRSHAGRDVPASADASEHAVAGEISGQLAAASTKVPAAHLDADELNAYVEDAVPAATRAHYMAHLAECERCRRIVTSVALTADRETESAPHPATLITSPTPSWSKRIAGTVATLFAPRTLKFALPMLLAVCGVVLGVLFLATHKRQNDSLVASRSGEVEIRPAVFSNTNSSVTTRMSSSASTDQADVAATSDASKATDSAHASPEKKINEADAPERLAANRGASSSPASPPADKALSTNLEATASPPALAPAPMPAPASEISEARVQVPPPVAASDEETMRIAEAPPVNQTSGGAAGKDSSTVEDKQAANDKRRANVANLPALGRSVAPPLTMAPNQSSAAQQASRKMRRGPDAAAIQKAESPAVVPVEVRRIGDRQFSRQPNQPRGQWIDSAYNSSLTTISVTRGSAHFRTLVADEPELGRIIEQLNGEIIIVWKKRAYHIR